MGHILDSAGVPAARRGTLGGSRTMAFWWSPKQLGIEAAREVEETELGFLHETKEGQIAHDGENARNVGTARTSQFTMTRDGDLQSGEVGLMAPITFIDPLTDIANIVTVPIRKFTEGSTAVLWTLDETPAIASGESMIFVADYPPLDAGRGIVGVSNWAALTANTDYQANANAGGTGANRTNSLTVTTTDAGNTRRIKIENGHIGQVYITKLQSRGDPLSEGQRVTIEVPDQDSIDAYGPRDYLVPAQFISSINDANSYGSFLLQLLKDPQTRAKVTFEGSRYEDAAESVDLSQRVTLRRNGVSADMYVEAVTDGLDNGGRHLVTLLLSPAASYGDLIILGTGPGLGAGVLAR